MSDALRERLRRSPLRHAVQWQRHRGLEAHDAYVASYPRSGNTWLRFVLAELLTGEPVDFVGVDRVSPPVGTQDGAPRLLPGGGRLVKTHEPYRPRYTKALYLIRDPRDVVISWYSLLTEDPASLRGFDAFLADFVAGRVAGYGSWQDHVSGWLAAAQRQPGAIQTARFEDMRADMPAFVARACALFGIDAGAAAIQTALRHNSKERMRELEREGLGYLKSLGWKSQGVRHGSIGGWRDVLEPRHLATLGPVLDLAEKLGYER
jgi:hypothetical protein